MNAHVFSTRLQAAATMTSKSVDVKAISELRDDLYHVLALCDALKQGMESACVANGLPALLLTIENAIDAAAERVHVLTFPDRGRAAA